MPLLSRSLRRPPFAPPFSFSLGLLRLAVPRRPTPLSQSPSRSSPSPLPATFSVRLGRALMRTSFSADVLPPPPLTVLFLLRNLASSSSSHSYSCSGNSLPPARRRTLLHFLRAFSPPRGNDASNAPAPPPLSFPPTLLLIRFPHPAAAADAVVFRLYVARLCNDTYNLLPLVSFTIASPGIIRGRITQFSRRASLSVGCARASLQIIARKLFLKMPRKET